MVTSSTVDVEREDATSATVAVTLVDPRGRHAVAAKSSRAASQRTSRASRQPPRPE